MATVSYSAVLELPRYRTWSEAQAAGLYTRTQLGQLDPPRKPAPEAAARGRILYHGNMYAPLYALDDAVPKRAVSPRQRAQLDRARALQSVCRYCGDQGEGSLGRGRQCGSCRAVETTRQCHEDGRSQAMRVLAGLGERRVFALGFSPDLAEFETVPGRVALVEVFGLADLVPRAEVMVDAWLTVAPGDRWARGGLTAMGYREALAAIDAVLPESAVLLGWTDPIRGLLRLLNWDGGPLQPDPYGGEARADAWHGAEEFAVLQGLRPGGDVRCLRVDYRFADWFFEPTAQSRPPRWERRYDLPLPEATGEPHVDALRAAEVLAAIAAGTAPVSPRAPWLNWPPTSACEPADGSDISAPCGASTKAG
jgi:hypothetical protein